MSYRIFLVNHGYYAADTFPSLHAAREWAERACYEVRFDSFGVPVAAWSPIGGYRTLIDDASPRGAEPDASMDHADRAGDDEAGMALSEAAAMAEWERDYEARMSGGDDAFAGAF